MSNKKKKDMMAEYRRRIREDPVAHEAYKQKERARYLKRKADGKIKLAKEMNERQHRSVKKKWRENTRNYRDRNHNTIDVPAPPTPALTPPTQISHQKAAGRKKLRRDERKAYRMINKLQDQVKDLRKNLKKLRRRNRKIVGESSNKKRLRKLKQEIGDAECVVQCDFSKNYDCKLGEETMSMHFGASKQQISLHTCHVTLRNETRCFCTASLDTRHMAPSILAHLEPVLTDLQKHGVQKLHVVSDGPTSEYRNNSNFQLLANIPYIVAGPGIGGEHDR